jgi:hypothetical protein
VRVARGVIVAIVLTLALSLTTAFAQPTPADVYVEQAVLEFDGKRYDPRYSNTNTVAALTGQSPKKRRDEEFANIFRIEVPLPAGFTVSGEYQSSINQSNVAVFAYLRNVVSLTLTWNY